MRCRWKKHAACASPRSSARDSSARRERSRSPPLRASHNEARSSWASCRVRVGRREWLALPVFGVLDVASEYSPPPASTNEELISLEEDEEEEEEDDEDDEWL